MEATIRITLHRRCRGLALFLESRSHDPTSSPRVSPTKLAQGTFTPHEV